MLRAVLFYGGGGFGFQRRRVRRIREDEQTLL
jgi:hypothetical protein